MAGWAAFAAAAPELAGLVEERLRAGRHLVLATLRADGSPRLSGTEVAWAGGELCLGVMAGAARLADLAHDPRLAIHSPSVDPVPGEESAWPGEAKLDGRAAVVEETEQSVTLRVELERVVLTTIAPSADHLVIRWWTPTGGERRVDRY